MLLRKWGLLGAALLIAAPVFADTYWGGFEDTVHGDYDYNDLVFSLTGNGLTLHSATGVWYGNPGTLSPNNGTPFWNHGSGDGNQMNIGYCIYGGGSCGAGLDPTANYLASATKGSVSDVYFSVHGNVDADIDLHIANDIDVLGWFSLSSPDNIHWINTGGHTGDYVFTPRGDFGLVGNNGNTHGGQNFYSDLSDCYGTSDSVAHFAFFDAPEPGMLGLVGGGLIAVGAALRKRRQAQAKS